MFGHLKGCKEPPSTTASTSSELWKAAVLVVTAVLVVIAVLVVTAVAVSSMAQDSNGKTTFFTFVFSCEANINLT